MSEFLQVAREAALAGGRVLQERLGSVQIREKAPKDLVTEADLESQRVIQEIVLKSFPEHDFRGEEDVRHEGAETRRSPWCWIVDPLDGTTNYAHGMPMYAVSIALCRDSEVEVGVVYDPSLDERFEAVRGQGATCNGEPIRSSRCMDLSAALVAASFSADVPRGSQEIDRFVEVLHRCQALRRMGSAALNLCYVAMGRLDGYWATSVKAWDVAAGVLLVREAGGALSGVDGAPFDLERPHFAAAATTELHVELLRALAGAEGSS